MNPPATALSIAAVSETGAPVDKSPLVAIQEVQS